MAVIIALVELIALAAMVGALARAIATDGFGTRPTPRSHPGELGSWITQHLTAPPSLTSKDTEAAA